MTPLQGSHCPQQLGGNAAVDTPGAAVNSSGRPPAACFHKLARSIREVELISWPPHSILCAGDHLLSGNPAKIGERNRGLVVDSRLHE